MQITATLRHKLPLQTGEGRNGQWKKQEIVVETDGQFPKKICVSIWGDKINDQILVEGSKLKISFDIESREYNGKWYTDVKAWAVEPADGFQGDTQNDYSTFNDFPASDGPEGDLPF